TGVQTCALPIYGAFTVLHSFLAPWEGGVEGAFTYAGLIQATDGNFYGLNSIGGSAFGGTAFKMTPAGVVTVLHEFDGTDGEEPRQTLAQGSDGNFYGVTPYSGPSQAGDRKSTRLN